MLRAKPGEPGIRELILLGTLSDFVSKMMSSGVRSSELLSQPPTTDLPEPKHPFTAPLRLEYSQHLGLALENLKALLCVPGRDHYLVEHPHLAICRASEFTDFLGKFLNVLQDMTRSGL